MSTWSDLKNNPRLKEIYLKRIAIVKLIREFFWSQDFVETETPLAVRFPGQEPYLNPMPVELFDPRGVKNQFYLHTSPEYSMKKLLAAGFVKIFQITKTFRNGESSGGLHNPEFTMIEWYRAPGTYWEIMEDTQKLFKFVAKKLGVEKLKWKNNEVNILSEWERISMKELWRKFVGVDLDKYLNIEILKYFVQERGYAVAEDDAYENLFFKIFLNEIEPKLGLDKPVFVYNYPAQMCSLSRPCENDARYAERFELYVGGVEVANAFGELTDAKEQKQKLEEDKNHRERLGKATWPVDLDFISALESGIPAGAKAGLPRQSSEGAAAGIALGVDRMVVLFTGAKDINEVIFGSISDQINF